MPSPKKRIYDALHSTAFTQWKIYKNKYMQNGCHICIRARALAVQMFFPHKPHIDAIKCRAYVKRLLASDLSLRVRLVRCGACKIYSHENSGDPIKIYLCIPKQLFQFQFILIGSKSKLFWVIIVLSNFWFNKLSPNVPRT